MRRLPLVAVAAVLMGAALPAAAQAKLEFNLPAQIYTHLDTSAASANDKERCDAVLFVEFHLIPRAVSYRIVVEYPAQPGRRDEFIAPPYETTGFTAKFPPPAGFARFNVGAYSTGAGCPAAIAETNGKVKIVSARVSLDKPFERRFKKVDKPPWICGYLPGSRSVKLAKYFGDSRKIIVRKRGTITTTEEDSNQPVNLHTNRYAETGTIIKTGPDSIVKIGALNGSSALVGPNTWVRITDSGFDVIKQPKRPGFHVPDRPGQDYKVRTCSSVTSARG